MDEASVMEEAQAAAAAIKRGFLSKKGRFNVHSWYVAPTRAEPLLLRAHCSRPSPTPARAPPHLASVVNTGNDVAGRRDSSC